MRDREGGNSQSMAVIRPDAGTNPNRITDPTVVHLSMEAFPSQTRASAQLGDNNILERDVRVLIPRPTRPQQRDTDTKGTNVLD